MTIISPKQHGRAGGNPLDTLVEATTAQTAILERIAHTLAMKIEHFYGLHPTQDNLGAPGFISFCVGCSELEQRFVFPCHAQPAEHPMPPSAFTLTPPADKASTPDVPGEL